MILSVSRRTDIPAFYSKWFMERLRAGFVMVRNPMNYHQVSQVPISPDVVDCIVFWSKNPLPLMKYIDEIKRQYQFYFQCTLNAYERDVEENLPQLNVKIHTFRQLAEQVGAERVIWRYDPIFISDKYTVDWHCQEFSRIADNLRGYTESCVFSFLDMYPKIKTNIKGLNMRSPNGEEIEKISKYFADVSRTCNLTLKTCAETVDLDKYGIQHNSCIDGELISRLIGCKLDVKKDKNQRAECGCLESIDIGQYNTCRHGCRYCYANFNPQSVITLSQQVRDDSPVLVGEFVEGLDKVTVRKIKLLREAVSVNDQMSLF